MTARTVSMGAPFRWLMKSLDVGRKNPHALFGGFAILLVIAMVPSVIQLVGQAMLPATSPTLLVVYGVSIIASLLLMPPVMGSAFVLMHGTERGLPVVAGDMLNGYGNISFASRMWLTTLLFLLAYALVLGVMVVVMPGKEFLVELVTRSAGLAPGQQPDMSGMPPFPPGLLLWGMLATLVVMVLSTANMLAYSRASLNARGAAHATVEGIMAALRNILPFLAFFIVVGIVGFIVLLIVALVAGIALALLAAISPVLGYALGVPIYLGLMLIFYVVYFGFFYHAWNEIFDEPVADPTDSIAA